MRGKITSQTAEEYLGVASKNILTFHPTNLCEISLYTTFSMRR
jgi:hypothetical protein